MLMLWCSDVSVRPELTCHLALTVTTTNTRTWPRP